MDSGKPWDADGAWVEALQKIEAGEAPELEDRLRKVLSPLFDALEENQTRFFRKESQIEDA